MLQVNPHFRPSAKYLLQNSIFDEIRIKKNELSAPQKLQMHCDLNEFKFNYETNQVDAFADHESQKKLLNHFKEQIYLQKLKLKRFLS